MTMLVSTVALVAEKGTKPHNSEQWMAVVRHFKQHPNSPIDSLVLFGIASHKQTNLPENWQPLIITMPRH